jgi:hypothetical protein
VLDTHSPLVCLPIAPLYGLRYSPVSCRLPPSDIQDKPPTVQVGHYGRPTVTSLVSPGQHLHRMVSCIMAIFSCYLYSRYFRSQYSWLSAGATSPTWRSDPWWYHTTVATFNLESCCRCGSFCSPCIVWGKQCHTSNYFFLIVHALLIYIFRVPEEQLTFWRTATQSVLLTDSPPPQPRLKAILRRLLAALQHLPLLLRGLWHGQPHLERNGGLGQRGLTK